MIKKIAGYSLLLFFIITCGIFCFYTYSRYSIIPSYQTKLMSMTHKHVNDVTNYLNEQEKNAIKLSEESAIIDALISTTGLKTESQLLPTLMTAHKETMRFKNIFLINTTGNIIFATTKQNIIGTNIHKDSTNNSSLSTSYQRASMTLTNDFSDFDFNILLQEPALLLHGC